MVWSSKRCSSEQTRLLARNFLLGKILTLSMSFEVAFFPVQGAKDRELSGFFETRRVSEGQTREDLNGEATPSLTYVSGWD